MRKGSESGAVLIAGSHSGLSSWRQPVWASIRKEGLRDLLGFDSGRHLKSRKKRTGLYASYSHSLL